MKRIAQLIACAILLLTGLMAGVRPANAVSVLIKQSATNQPVAVLLTDSATGQIGQTGKAGTAVVTVELPGATSFIAASGTLTDTANGLYDYAPTTTETGTLGILKVHITCTGCQVCDASAQIVAFDPRDSAALGLTGVPISYTQALPTNPAAGTTGDALYYASQQIGRRGTAQGGASTTITLDAGASATDNSYMDHEIKLTGGTGSGQFATIIGYVGSTKVATISRPGTGGWTTTPDNTTTFMILPQPQSAVYRITDKTGYALSVTPPTASQIAAVILANPSNLLVTDSGGSPVLSTAVMQAIRDTTFGKIIDGTLTAQDVLVLDAANLAGAYTNSYNSGTRTLTTTYKRQDGTTTAYTSATLYSAGSTSPPVSSRTGTNGTLP